MNGWQRLFDDPFYEVKQEGADARLSGFDRSDNPYTIPEYRDAWLEGYDNPEKFTPKKGE